MARRMFSPSVVETDMFLDMPPTTQNLYFHLGMKADDDGFITPRMVMRVLGSTEDDLKVLIAKKFVIPFESGVIVIRHWKTNNLVRKDWYKETIYLQEKSELNDDVNGDYKLVNNSLTQDRSGQVRIGQDRIEERKRSNFSPPSLDEVKNYCLTRKNNIDSERFIDFYESKGWMIGKNRMKDWQAAVRTWENRNKESGKKVEEEKAVIPNYAKEYGKLNKI